MDIGKTPENMPFLDMVWHYKYMLAFYTIIISFGSFTILYLVGFVPSELRLLNNPVNSAYNAASSVVQVIGTTTPLVKNETTKQSTGQLPNRIIIGKIGVDSFVSNPIKSDTATLNESLLKGAVRYPGSGTLGVGNMFLFGHSTGIRVVNNQAYKAFNRLNQMDLGDTIKVQSENVEYLYEVVSVSLVDSDEKLVDFSKNKNMLTLSTCDVFGEKQERYVIEARFIKSLSLKN